MASVPQELVPALRWPAATSSSFITEWHLGTAARSGKCNTADFPCTLNLPCCAISLMKRATSLRSLAGVFKRVILIEQVQEQPRELSDKLY